MLVRHVVDRGLGPVEERHCEECLRVGTVRLE
jgi:hypothetical protein